MSDLGPKPHAEIEPGEPNPGGADAIEDSDGVDGEAADSDLAPRDLDPERNPAVEDELPDEMKQSEDTDTKATKDDTADSGEGDDDGDDDAQEETPA